MKPEATEPFSGKIELRKVQGERGTLAIYVDGCGWGWALMNSHGSRGTSYNFRSVHSGLIQVPYDDGAAHWKGSNRLRRKAFVVYGDKMAARNARDGEVIAPLEKRLIDAVHLLIQCGHLKHPDVEDKENKDRTARAFRAAADAKAVAKAKLEAKARAVLKSLRAYMGTPNEDDVATIVDLIEWSKHQ